MPELVDQRIGELGIVLLQRCGRCGELNAHARTQRCSQSWTYFGGHRLQRANQLLDAIGRMRCAHLRKRPATFAIGKSGGEQCRCDDTADEDEKHATLHRRDECFHDVVSSFTSALNT